MKKILAIILVLACVFSVVSCKKKNPESTYLTEYTEYLASSAPTKSETHIKQTYSTLVLESSVMITTGTIDGKTASILQSKVQTLESLDELTLNHISEKTTTHWYLEGKGLSTNKGRKWDETGKNFAPTQGSIVLDLSEDNFSEIAYNEETGVLVLTVPAANSKKVLADFVPESQDFAHDTVITLSAAGGRISSIKIEYTVESYDIGDIGNEVEFVGMTVVIEANYSYDIQDISFD